MIKYMKVKLTPLISYSSLTHKIKTFSEVNLLLATRKVKHYSAKITKRLQSSQIESLALLCPIKI